MRYTLATLLVLSSTTLAHGGVRVYTINGKAYEGYVPPIKTTLLQHANLTNDSYEWSFPPSAQHSLIQRSWHQNPFSDPDSTNITCNYHGLPVPGAYHAPISAGDTISATWSHDGFGWVHTHGPMMAYMALCPNADCTTTDIGELGWFKIAQEGLREGYLVGEDKGWFQGDLWENRITDHWDVTLPKGLKAGKISL
jgi:hypothetical protein